MCDELFGVLLKDVVMLLCGDVDFDGFLFDLDLDIEGEVDEEILAEFIRLVEESSARDDFENVVE